MAWTGGMLKAVWRKLRACIVADVPLAVAVCEFDCPKDACDPAHFATCPRRLAGEARERARGAG